MNFRYINPHNLQWLLPPWAADHWALARELDSAMAAYYSAYPRVAWDRPQSFWIEVAPSGCGLSITTRVPEDDGAGKENCGLLFFKGDAWTVCLPVNDILKGAPRNEGTHSIYCHVVQTDVPLHYIGLTKQRWFDRLAQHRSAARNGSHLMFHRALREHPNATISSRVLLCSVNEEAALFYEEELVAGMSLYPLGLNMIPGGRAGFSYLAKLGIAARNAAERDAAVDDLVSRPPSDGRPNPLCAARWETDQDYVNRVICGHGGRLTVSEVETIRALAAVGRQSADIAAATGRPAKQIGRVVSGASYGRIKP
jgi:hypothetical protein